MSRTWALAMVLFIIAACRDPERAENEKTASAQSALTGKEIFGTYERSGEPYAGAVASIALVPGACDVKQQAALDEKADGAVFATLYTECATPTCKEWKTTDLTGSFRIVPGEGHIAKVQIDLVTVEWGDAVPVFQGVVEGLNVKYTLFLPNGTPARASVQLKMKEANSLLNKKGAEEANKAATAHDAEGLAPSKKLRCTSAACECAAQGSCSGSWACIDHACVCETKPK